MSIDEAHARVRTAAQVKWGSRFPAYPQTLNLAPGYYQAVIVNPDGSEVDATAPAGNPPSPEAALNALADALEGMSPEELARMARRRELEQERQRLADALAAADEEIDRIDNPPPPPPEPEQLPVIPDSDG